MDENNKQDKLEETIGHLDKKIDKILFILKDDNETSTKGLVSRFNEHEKKMDTFINEYNTAQKIKDAKAGLLGAVAGGIVSGLTIFFKIFNSQHGN